MQFFGLIEEGEAMAQRSLIKGLLVMVGGLVGVGPAQAETSFVGNQVILNTDVQVGYGTLHDSLKLLVNKALRDRLDGVEHCEKTGKKGDPRPSKKQYSCGEIPFGEIRDKNWKSVTDFKIDAQSVNSDGIQINTEPVRIALWMGRPQYQGTVEIDDLDSTGKRSIVTNRKFGKDFYVRYNPREVEIDGAKTRAMNMDFCAAIPGTYWTIPPFNINGRGKKKVWFFSISSGFTVTVNPGSLMYRYAEGCGKIQTLIDPRTKAPQVRGLSFSNPKLADARYEGLDAQIRFHNWLVNLVVKVFIGQSKVNRMLRDALQKKVSSVVTDRDLRSGKWLEKLQDEFFQKRDIKKSMAESFERALNSELAHMNYADPNKYRAELRKICDEMDKGIFKSVGTIRSECLKVVNSAELELTPFLRKKDQAELGCYSHMASLFATREKIGGESSRKWWYNRCTHAAGVRVKIKTEAAPLLACLSKVQGAFTSSSSLEQRLNGLKKCAKEAEWLVGQFPKLQPWLASIEDVIKNLKEKFPAEGLEFVPGRWPMVDWSLLRSGALAQGLEFLRDGDRRIFNLPRQLELGPDLPIPSGAYSIQFWTDVAAQARAVPQRLGVIEIWDTTRNERLAVQAFWSHQSVQAPLSFTVPSENARLQLKFQWDQAVDLRLSKVRIKRLGEVD